MPWQHGKDRALETIWEVSMTQKWAVVWALVVTEQVVPEPVTEQTNEIVLECKYTEWPHFLKARRLNIINVDMVKNYFIVDVAIMGMWVFMEKNNKKLKNTRI